MFDADQPIADAATPFSQNFDNSFAENTLQLFYFQWQTSHRTIYIEVPNFFFYCPSQLITILTLNYYLWEAFKS